MTNTLESCWEGGGGGGEAVSVIDPPWVAAQSYLRRRPNVRTDMTCGAEERQ